MSWLVVFASSVLPVALVLILFAMDRQPRASRSMVGETVTNRRRP
jgi:hypothetical protein